MSTIETSAPETPTDEHAHDHPGDLLYIQVAIILSLLTGVEVLTYFVDFGSFQTPTLLVLMVVKFAMVLMFFMHLRFDHKLFSWVFVAGLVLAGGVYAAALLAFEFF